MAKRQLGIAAVLIVLAVPALTSGAASRAAADVRSMALPIAQTVNVSVSFNTQSPIADLSEQAVVAAQKASRTLIYRLADQECVVLKETIAETCRLTRLNVSTQIRHRNAHNPPMLNLNGNAQFSITLKNGDADGQQ